MNLSPLDARWLFDFTGPRLPAGWDAAYPASGDPGASFASGSAFPRSTNGWRLIEIGGCLLGSTRASFLAAAVSAVLAGAVVPACSPAGLADAGESTSDAQPPCPASFIDVATASCSLEGQACTYLAPCATFAANATCVCTGGAFVCNGFGDAAVTCPVLTTTEACPAVGDAGEWPLLQRPGPHVHLQECLPGHPRLRHVPVRPARSTPTTSCTSSARCRASRWATPPCRRPWTPACPTRGSDVVEPPVDAPAPSPDGGGASDP